MEAAGLLVVEMVGNTVRGGWVAVHRDPGIGVVGGPQQALEIWAAPRICLIHSDK